MFDQVNSVAVQQAISAIDAGDTLHGLITLECTPEFRAIPVVNSYLAFCMAKERGQISNALGMCQSALATEPNHPAHYLNLGRVYLLARDKPKAIATFWRGISKSAAHDKKAAVAGAAADDHHREHELILDELRKLGIRKQLPFPSLGRSHPLNKFVGKFLANLGMR